MDRKDEGKQQGRSPTAAASPSSEGAPRRRSLEGGLGGGGAAVASVGANVAAHRERPAAPPMPLLQLAEQTAATASAAARRMRPSSAWAWRRAPKAARKEREREKGTMELCFGLHLFPRPREKNHFFVFTPRENEKLSPFSNPHPPSSSSSSSSLLPLASAAAHADPSLAFKMSKFAAASPSVASLLHWSHSKSSAA